MEDGGRQRKSLEARVGIELPLYVFDATADSHALRAPVPGAIEELPASAINMSPTFFIFGIVSAWVASCAIWLAFARIGLRAATLLPMALDM
jgi:hypothetical protein